MSSSVKGAFVSSWTFVSVLVALTLTLNVRDAQGVFFFREANARIDRARSSDDANRPLDDFNRLARSNDGYNLNRPCNFRLNYEDSQLTTPEIIERYNYSVEIHKVVTEDGYILELHRIPNPGKPPVFLMHGMFGSSRTFVINCEKRALAFLLFDRGYDVWMGNYRGNYYSRNHTTLSVDGREYWNFSEDQVAFYDAPATIDHILSTTKAEKVSWVGISMGNGIAMAFLSSRPEYNDKIQVWFAMAAALTLKDTRSPLLRLAAPFPGTFDSVLTRFNHGEFVPRSIVRMIKKYGPMACHAEGRRKDHHGLCALLYFMTTDGYDPGQIPAELLSVVLGEVFNPTSVKFFTQWSQWIISGKLSYYDWGPRKNLQRYGTVTPKLYPIKNIRCPTVLFWAENDWLTTKADVATSLSLINQMSSGYKPELIKVASPSWNHADYMHGQDADIYVYNHIISRLDKIYEKS